MYTRAYSFISDQYKYESNKKKFKFKKNVFSSLDVTLFADKTSILSTMSGAILMRNRNISI